MIHYRKNVGGVWETCSLTKEEAKAIQEKVLKIGLAKLLEVRKIASENKINLEPEVEAVLLQKIVPSYESLANDFIESSIKNRNTPAST